MKDEMRELVCPYKSIREQGNNQILKIKYRDFQFKKKFPYNRALHRKIWTDSYVEIFSCCFFLPRRCLKAWAVIKEREALERIRNKDPPPQKKKKKKKKKKQERQTDRITP